MDPAGAYRIRRNNIPPVTTMTQRVVAGPQGDQHSTVLETRTTPAQMPRSMTSEATQLRVRTPTSVPSARRTLESPARYAEGALPWPSDPSIDHAIRSRIKLTPTYTRGHLVGVTVLPAEGQQGRDSTAHLHRSTATETTMPNSCSPHRTAEALVRVLGVSRGTTLGRRLELRRRANEQPSIKACNEEHPQATQATRDAKGSMRIGSRRTGRIPRTANLAGTKAPRRRQALLRLP